MEIREDAEILETSEALATDLIEGYIHPEDYVSEEDAEKVRMAIDIFIEFQRALEENDLLEFI